MIGLVLYSEKTEGVSPQISVIIYCLKVRQMKHVEY